MTDIPQSADPAAPADVAAPGGLVPLTEIQQAIWVRNRLRPGSENQPITVRLRGQLDLDVLASALGLVLERHPVLRNTYPLADSGPHQHAMDVGPVAPVLLDRSDLPADHALEAAMAVYYEELDRPTDLENEVVFRPTVVKLRADDHVLVLGVSHISFDGTSAEILTSDLEEFYRSLVMNEVPDVPPLPRSYETHARLEAHTQDEQTLRRELDWWTSELADLPPNPRFPTRPEPAASYHMVRRSLTTAQYNAMGELAADAGTTQYVGHLTALQLLVAEVTGEDDFLTGFATHGRTPEVEHVVGCFINPMVVRSRLGDSATVRDQLEAMGQRLRSALDHAKLPHHRLIRELRPGLDSDGVLHNVHFQMDRFRRRKAAEPVVAMTNYRPGGNGEETGLVVEVNPHDEGAEVRFEFDVASFSRSDVETWADRYLEIIDEMVTDPERSLRPPRPSIPAEPFLPDLLARHALDRPNALAIQGEDRTVTYAELNALANRYAHAYRAHGVQPGSFVALSADRTPETIAAMLGALKIGVGYVPIDPDQPAARQLHVLADSKPALFVTERAADEFGPDAELPQLLREADVPLRDDVPAPSYSADSPAYVIYTSGSTGKPKGVVISQRALASFVAAAGQRYGLGVDDRMLQFHSMAFDASVEEIHLPLAVGAAVVLRTPDFLGPLDHVLARLEGLEVTAVSLPTALWHELALQMHGPVRMPNSLRLLIIGGEAARSDLVTRWQRSAGAHVRLLNTYGPTETTVVVTAADITNQTPGEYVSIGAAFAGVDVAVCGPDGRDVSPGEWGELYVAGPQLASGYHGLPNLTARSFVSRSVGGRWYRTGDRARVRADGHLEVAGRFDDQVKINGHRIEPAEVERQLELHAQVGRAVVSVRGAGSDRHLVAHLVASADRTAQIDLDQVRADLAENLPRYLMPSHLMEVPDFPRTVGGKIDRNALPAPGRSETIGRVGAMDGVTEQVLMLWREVLSLPGAGPDDDFFDLGGQSLKAVQLLVRVEEHFKIRLAMSTLFEAPTARGLAGQIIARDETKPVSDAELEVRRGHVLMQHGSPERRPLFLIHAAGGHVMLYQALVRRLARTTTVHGLEAPGVEDNGVPMNRIEDVAAVHAVTMRSIQPNGPYRLAGFSVGGTVAFETARMLVAQGQEVEFLGMIDTVFPVGERSARSTMYSRLIKERDLEGLNERVRGAFSRRFEATAAKISRRPVSPQLAAQQVAHLLGYAHFAYVPRAFDGRITYYYGVENLDLDERRGDDPELWGAVALRGIDVVEVSGSHREYRMLREPHVEGLGDHLRSELARLDGRDGTASDR